MNDQDKELINKVIRLFASMPTVTEEGKHVLSQEDMLRLSDMKLALKLQLSDNEVLEIRMRAVPSAVVAEVSPAGDKLH